MTNGSPPAKKPARLGRGLSALVGTAPAVQVERAPTLSDTDSSANNAPGVVMLPVGEVLPNPHQPRRSFDEEALAALAASIGRDGLMQPVVVRRVSGGGGDGGGGGGGGYELVAGERRLRASRLAGLDRIPAIVREADDRSSAELALIENLQRADLNPVERARAFRALIDRHGLTQAEVGERMGMDRSSVANHLRLLDLDARVLALVEAGRLGLGHAKALLGVDDAGGRLALAELAAAESWSVRAVERAAAGEDGADASHPGVSHAPGAGARQSEHNEPSRARAVLDDMERRLSEHLGTRVTLRTDRKGQKGSVTIEFFSLDEFDGLLERLGYRHDVS
jgi:ParB family chromosome partitioning protein